MDEGTDIESSSVSQRPRRKGAQGLIVRPLALESSTLSHGSCLETIFHEWTDSVVTAIFLDSLCPKDTTLAIQLATVERIRKVTKKCGN